ncbi:MAG: DUF3179 domain-containing (seleno)protein [Chloroflexota bacterium]|nr:DUF3179 domain-containing (seleno)protein [Chloroflexota bacterium]
MTTLSSLEQCVEKGLLKPEESLLVLEVNHKPLALVTVQLVYHHVAQGMMDGQPWLVSFCSICNGGAVFSPQFNDTSLNFSARGVYDAMILLGDDETNSYWDHLSGLCVYGPSSGKQLKRLSNLLHSTAQRALVSHPGIQVALSVLSAEQQTEALDDDAWRQEAQPEWSARMLSTLAHDDHRLPRLDIGLGVWAGRTSRYYPISHLHGANNIIIDNLNGRNLLVYIDPVSITPDAFYTNATTAEFRRTLIVLDNGDIVRDGAVFTHDGVQKPVERPLQLFSRWYAFAVRFPGCEIYMPQFA